MTVDMWTFHHILGGLALGLTLYHATGGRGLAWTALAVILAWEVFENNVLGSWLGLVSVEPIQNSLWDVLFTYASALTGGWLYRRLRRVEVG